VLTVETATNGVEQRLRAGALCVPVVLGCADGMGTRPDPAGPRPHKSGTDRRAALALLEPVG
jgi:hypothetical protein